MDSVFPTHYKLAPWHFLNFLPEPHGHGSFRPTFDQSPVAFAAPLPPAIPGTFAVGLIDRVRPAPTTTGSCRAAAFFFGGSDGPTSMTFSSAAAAPPSLVSSPAPSPL